jgi:molybdopterin synthase catalytic subunit
MSHLTTDPLDLAALLDETGDERSGALVVFGGTVRNSNDGRPVAGIHYSAHAPLAEKTLTDIEQETLSRFDIRQCRILHRVGDLSLREFSVLVVVRAAHRAAAFDAARYAIDTLKQRVPIWKEELYPEGDSRFLEGTPLQDVEAQNSSGDAARGGGCEQNRSLHSSK